MIHTQDHRINIDVWASVQPGYGARHGDHVHEGAIVSGVYYAAVPDGSAPLVFRKPVVDGAGFGVADGEGGRQSNREREGEKNEDDFVLNPKEAYPGKN